MNTSDLTHGSVWKVIIRFALPAAYRELTATAL